MIFSPFSNFASNTADEILFPILAVDFVFIDSLQSTVGPVATDESYALSSPSENGDEALPSYLSDNQKSTLADDILSWNNNVRDVPKALSPFEIDPMPLFVEAAFCGIKLKVFH